MQNRKLPLYDFHELSKLVGKLIISCHRKFHEEIDSEMDEILFCELDADTFFLFSDKSLLGFSADTENFSLFVLEAENLDRESTIDVSKIDFWKERLGVTIVGIELLYGSHPTTAMGLIFQLSNGLNFKVLYESESEYDFDAVVIR